MTVDIGRTGIWCGVFDAHPTVEVQSACAELERLGYSAVWLPEAVGRDPFVAASTCLAATHELKLATGIANIYARDPMTMAACQMTLAEAFPGRFLLGLGVSHHHLVERLRKHDYSKPLSYMQNYLTAMDHAMFEAIGPDENPGRVLAALGPKMLATAADRASGAHPYFTTAEHTARARQIMGPDALLAPEQMVVLESDPGAARAIAAGRHVGVPPGAELPTGSSDARLRRGRLRRPPVAERPTRRRHRRVGYPGTDPRPRR